LPVVLDLLADKAGQTHFRAHHRLEKPSATAEAFYDHDIVIPPCIYTRTGNLAEASMFVGRAILKLRQFSLTFVMGLVHGNGGPPIPWGHHAPAAVASTVVPGRGL